MISVNSSYVCGVELASFPDIVIDLYRLHDLHSGSTGIKTLLNKPDLDYWILLVEKQVSLKKILDWFNRNSYADMNKLFMMYTIISAANRRTLKRKMCGLKYFRSRWSDSLYTLKWVSAKYAYVEPKKVLWMQSPILLFDRSVSRFFANSWFSAFVSLLSTGVLDFVIHYAHFCLGTFKANPSELLSEQFRV
jgi:hypothetical protein